MPVVESLTNYWDIPIRSDDLFSKIVTPDWASRVATIKTKRWLLAEALGYADPEDVPKELVERMPDFGESHARQGRLNSTNQWMTQSVLIPKDLVTRQQAGKIACYIVEQIDRTKPSVC